MSIADDHRPVLLRGVRLRHDRVRDRRVLLAPERALELDAVGLAVLDLVDGRRTFGEIVDTLARAYNAPPELIARDSRAFLQSLVDRRMMETAP